MDQIRVDLPAWAEPWVRVLADARVSEYRWHERVTWSDPPSDAPETLARHLDRIADLGRQRVGREIAEHAEREGLIILGVSPVTVYFDPDHNPPRHVTAVATFVSMAYAALPEPAEWGRHFRPRNGS